MPKILADADGNLILPKSFMERRQMRSCSEYWLDEREGDLILHPRVPNARKLYIEPTTVCNLKCSTCIRNVWGDPIASMTRETFDKILNSLDGHVYVFMIITVAAAEAAVGLSIIISLFRNKATVDVDDINLSKG